MDLILALGNKWIIIHWTGLIAMFTRIKSYTINTDVTQKEQVQQKIESC